MHSTSAKAVLPKLDRIFAAYGVPQVVKSDNGPPFNVTNYLGFKLCKVTPPWPEANGEVERFIKTFGNVLRPALLTGNNICTSPYETMEQLLIVQLVLVLPLPSLEDQPCPTLLLFHAKQV